MQGFRNVFDSAPKMGASSKKPEIETVAKTFADEEAADEDDRSTAPEKGQ